MLGKESPQFPQMSVLEPSLSFQDVLVFFSSKCGPFVSPHPKGSPGSLHLLLYPLMMPPPDFQSPQGDGKIYQVPAIPKRWSKLCGGKLPSPPIQGMSPGARTALLGLPAETSVFLAEILSELGLCSQKAMLLGQKNSTGGANQLPRAIT